ncbi:MAG: TRAP transporter substrate-binding protein DctP [Defluviimonas sp.]|nr:TRAP transporter substrate-binding protein DctP [Defluviimonas sp.]
MKNISFGTSLLALVAAFAAPAMAEDLVLPNEVAATHWKTDYQNEFAQMVGERTNGEISVKVFPAGQLYNEQDALAALGTGAVQMVWPVSVRVESIEPATGVINLPFAISDEKMANDCFAKGLTEVMSSYVEPRGLKILGLLRTADLFFIFKDDEVTKMEDLKGKKVRVTGGKVFLDTMDRLGISPVSMAASEMSTAMSQGAIDGVFSSPAGWSEMIGITGKYGWYVPGFSLSTYSVVVDKGWFDGLPAEQQEAITSSLNEISKRQWVDAKVSDEKAIQKMLDQGAVFHTADEVEAGRWRDLASESATSFTEAHPEVMEKMAGLEKTCGLGG